MILFSLIQIGPPNSQFLKSKDKSTWTAKDVADFVLADKAALVICLRVILCSKDYFHFPQLLLVWQSLWNFAKGIGARRSSSELKSEIDLRHKFHHNGKLIYMEIQNNM